MIDKILSKGSAVSTLGRVSVIQKGAVPVFVGMTLPDWSFSPVDLIIPFMLATVHDIAW